MTFYNKHKNFIIEKYKELKNIKEVANILECTPATIRKILKKENIPLFPKPEKFNTSFFENINTENKAYWLGFIYADGYNSEKNSKVVVCLHEQDLSLLNKLKDHIGFKGNIHQYPKRKNVILTLCSKKLSKDLVNQGCPQNKTYKLIFPDCSIVPKNLISHFMRGYFDGDGCITNYNYMSVMSNKNFIKVYQSRLAEFCALNKDLPLRARHEHNQNILYFTYGGTGNLQKIYNFFYKDATIYLERKKKRFENVLKNRAKINNLKTKLINNCLIKIDDNDRVCITDIWKAYGAMKYRRPAEWLRTNNAILAREIKNKLGEAAYSTNAGGYYTGTYCCKEIANYYENFLKSLLP